MDLRIFEIFSEPFLSLLDRNKFCFGNVSRNVLGMTFPERCSGNGVSGMAFLKERERGRERELREKSEREWGRERKNIITKERVL